MTVFLVCVCLPRCDPGWVFVQQCFLCSVPVFISSVAFTCWIQFRYSPLSGILTSIVCVLGLLLSFGYVWHKWKFTHDKRMEVRERPSSRTDLMLAQASAR